MPLPDQGKRDFLRNGAGNNDDSGTACIFTGISCAKQNGADKHLLVTDFTSGNQCFWNFHAETELYADSKGAYRGGAA